MKKEKDNSKIFLISLIWKHLSPKRRNQLFLLFLLIILSGVAEIYSVASVIPFLNNLSNSESIYTQGSTSILNLMLKFANTDQ